MTDMRLVQITTRHDDGSHSTRFYAPPEHIIDAIEVLAGPAWIESLMTADEMAAHLALGQGVIIQLKDDP